LQSRSQPFVTYLTSGVMSVLSIELVVVSTICSDTACFWIFR